MIGTRPMIHVARPRINMEMIFDDSNSVTVMATTDRDFLLETDDKEVYSERQLNDNSVNTLYLLCVLKSIFSRRNTCEK